MILNKISQIINKKHIKQQAVFQEGMSRTSQILSLVQEITDGYKNEMTRKMINH